MCSATLSPFHIASPHPRTRISHSYSHEPRPSKQRAPAVASQAAIRPSSSIDAQPSDPNACSRPRRRPLQPARCQALFPPIRVKQRHTHDHTRVRASLRLLTLRRENGAETTGKADRADRPLRPPFELGRAASKAGAGWRAERKREKRACAASREPTTRASTPETRKSPKGRSSSATMFFGVLLADLSSAPPPR